MKTVNVIINGKETPIGIRFGYGWIKAEKREDVVPGDISWGVDQSKFKDRTDSGLTIVTACELITPVDEGEGDQRVRKTDVLVKTFAYCVPQDNFSRRLGRRMALQRALIGLDFTDEGPMLVSGHEQHVFRRERRRKIWELYFDLHADLKKKPPQSNDQPPVIHNQVDGSVQAGA